MKTTEEVRQEVQRHIDDSKVQGERNRLGQFATEWALAKEMLTYASQLLPPNEAVSFLDPAFGTGAFYSALVEEESRLYRKEFPSLALPNDVGSPVSRRLDARNTIVGGLHDSVSTLG